MNAVDGDSGRRNDPRGTAYLTPDQVHAFVGSKADYYLKRWERIEERGLSCDWVQLGRLLHAIVLAPLPWHVPVVLDYRWGSGWMDDGPRRRGYTLWWLVLARRLTARLGRMPPSGLGRSWEGYAEKDANGRDAVVMGP